MNYIENFSPHNPVYSDCFFCLTNIQNIQFTITIDNKKPQQTFTFVRSSPFLPINFLLIDESINQLMFQLLKSCVIQEKMI